MPKAARDVPPPLELLCLKALWSLQEGNVKEVRRVVARIAPAGVHHHHDGAGPPGAQGQATRRKVGRAFVYAPQASRDAMRQGGRPGTAGGLLRRLGRGADLRSCAGPSPPAPPRHAAPVAEDRIDTVLL